MSNEVKLPGIYYTIEGPDGIRWSDNYDGRRLWAPPFSWEQDALDEAWKYAWNEYEIDAHTKEELEAAGFKVVVVGVLDIGVVERTAVALETCCKNLRTTDFCCPGDCVSDTCYVQASLDELKRKGQEERDIRGLGD
jgi:hypothetical protein